MFLIFLLVAGAQSCSMPVCDPLLFKTISGDAFECSSVRGFLGEQWLPNGDESALTLYQSIKNIGKYRVEIDTSYLMNVSIQQSPNDLFSSVELGNEGFNAQTNLQISLNNTIIILKCNAEWAFKIGCGTFLEIHYPFNDEILIQKQIDSSEVPVSLSLNDLCAGVYHLWFVYSTRIGKIVKNVKGISIGFPSCKC